MVAVAEPDTVPDTIEATVNYHPGEANLSSPDALGGRAQDSRRVVLRNGRLDASGFALDRSGFRFVRHDSAVVDFFDDEEVRHTYHPEIEALVKAESGAS